MFIEYLNHSLEVTEHGSRLTEQSKMHHQTISPLVDSIWIGHMEIIFSWHDLQYRDSTWLDFGTKYAMKIVLTFINDIEVTHNQSMTSV